MRLTIGLLLLSLCGLGMAVGPSSGATVYGDGTRSLVVGDLAPDWTLSDPAGKTHTLSDYRGKIVVLDFWATWCGKCAALMPRLEKLHRKYRNRGVVVLGVNTWETDDPVATMKKKRITYGLLLKGEEVAAAYGVASVPVICVIGVDGRVVYYQAGVDDHNLDAVIEKYLKERKT
jgi:thiol-disulfide isomerase/thioredoxin